MHIHIRIHGSFHVPDYISHRVRGRANRYDSSYGHGLQYLRGHRRGLRVYPCIHTYVYMDPFMSQVTFPIVCVVAQTAMTAVMDIA